MTHTRISMRQLFMEIAHNTAKRSTCYRLNVGAVVVYENNVISMGYNGAPPKAPHCTGNDCAGRTPGMCPTIHAEINALNKATISDPALDLYLTHSPCLECCKFIIADGRVRAIYFSTPYRDTQHLKMFTFTQVYNLTPAGYLVDWLTNDVVETL